MSEKITQTYSVAFLSKLTHIFKVQIHREHSNFINKKAYKLEVITVNYNPISYL